MTETDATRRPLTMPEKFLPYLEKHRIYLLFKKINKIKDYSHCHNSPTTEDMVRDVVINLPKDHLKQMKVFLSRHIHCNREADRVILLVSPDLNIDIKKLVKVMIKDHGFFVITRRSLMDRYEKHDEYVPGCVSPELLSEVTKNVTLKEPVPNVGWLMFDHPCTLREARCLQQDGVLPTVTLVLMPKPPQATPAHDPRTPYRNFFQQDFEGLKYAYKATLKEVHVVRDDDPDKIAIKCFNAITACTAGLQGPKQGLQVVGAPGVYRVLMIGPRGAGCKTQAVALAKHFGLIYLNFTDLLNEAREKNDDISEKLRIHGPSIQMKADIVKRRVLKKDCVDKGWVLTGYPTTAMDFEHLDNMVTPPNRIIFLNTDMATCKARLMSQGVDWCTGRPAAPGSGPRVVHYHQNNEAQLDAELDLYYSEALAELRAAAGLTAVEIDANKPIDQIQVKIQAAVISAPAFDIEWCSQLRNVRAD